MGILLSTYCTPLPSALKTIKEVNIVPILKRMQYSINWNKLSKSPEIIFQSFLVYKVVIYIISSGLGEL